MHSWHVYTGSTTVFWNVSDIISTMNICVLFLLWLLSFTFITASVEASASRLCMFQQQFLVTESFKTFEKAISILNRLPSLIDNCKGQSVPIMEFTLVLGNVRHMISTMTIGNLFSLCCQHISNSSKKGFCQQAVHITLEEAMLQKHLKTLVVSNLSMRTVTVAACIRLWSVRVLGFWLQCTHCTKDIYMWTFTIGTMNYVFQGHLSTIIRNWYYPPNTYCTLVPVKVLYIDSFGGVSGAQWL